MTELKSLELHENLAQMDIATDVLLLLDKEFALSRNLVPYKFVENTLYVATNKSENILETTDVLRIIRYKSPQVKKLFILLTTYENISAGCTKSYGANPAAISSNTLQRRNNVVEEDTTVTTEITKLVDDIIASARSHNASDIHITPLPSGSLVQFRITGRLITQDYSIGETDKKIVVNRIKTLAEMDSAQSHVAADGNFSFGDIDFRVNTYPCGDGFGEKVNIRLLDSNSNLKRLEDIGFAAEDLELMNQIIMQPYGIVLMTGPTGQGKSTTLYACLRERGAEDNVIISAEDPVEQRIDGATQSPIKVNRENEKLSWTFEKAIRAMMRQDPDIILIGEIRDKATAVTAIQASQTGHLVFATLHTRSAIGSVQRMIDIGVDRSSFLAEMDAIISQRLVATNCPHCMQKVESKYNRLLRKKDLARLEAGRYSYKSCGCEKCSNTGITSKRLPIVEIIKFSNELRDFFTERRGLRETETFLRSKGYRSLWDKGMDLVTSKRLSLDELCSVLAPDEDLDNDPGLADEINISASAEESYEKELLDNEQQIDAPDIPKASDEGLAAATVVSENTPKVSAEDEIANAAVPIGAPVEISDQKTFANTLEGDFGKIPTVSVAAAGNEDESTGMQ